MDLDMRAFSFWSIRLSRWVVEAGEFTISVGHSSRDLPLAQTLHLGAPSLVAPLTGWSTLHEWRSDPLGRSLLDEVVTEDSPLADEELVKVIGTMPMSTLAAFPGMGIGHEALADLIERWEQGG